MYVLVHIIYTSTVASAPTVAGSVFMRRIRLYFGIVRVNVKIRRKYHETDTGQKYEKFKIYKKRKSLQVI